MMENIKRYYEGDIKSIIVDTIMVVIYMATVTLVYANVLYIFVDVVINHNNLDGRGTFVSQVVMTTKDQFLMIFGNTIKNYFRCIAVDLNFRSDARIWK